MLFTIKKHNLSKNNAANTSPLILTIAHGGVTFMTPFMIPVSL